MQRQIVAISGGGFSEEKNAYIDDYIVNLVKRDKPVKIAFIATASNDAKGYIDKFYEAFNHQLPSHITIQDFELPNIQDIVNELDIIYVGGGNTKYMLNIWRETGFDQVLKQAYENGVVLAGISAGAMCWFERCFSENEEFDGLGILKGSLCPHYNHQAYKMPYDKWISTLIEVSSYRLKDNESLYFKNEQRIAMITT